MKNLITCLVVCVLSGAAIADTWTVDDDGKADFDNIQAAVDAASDGDEIIVMPGTYTSTADEVVNMLGKAVWLHSSDGPEVTIVNGEDVRRGILCNGGETTKTIIEGLTITHGNAGIGGGMFNYQPTNQDVCDPTLIDCRFLSNAADYGGGMYNYGQSTPTLENCTFEYNTATEDGGGMYNDNCPPVLQSCIFASNEAEDEGGGMYNKSSNPLLTDCTFMSNSAEYGGGMYNFVNSTPTLENCTFNDNSVGVNGGGMLNFISSPTLTDCTFTGNTADYGGGMYNYAKSTPTLTGCTLMNNNANSLGGGIYNADSSSDLMDTTVCGNTPDQISGDYTNGGGNTIADECPVDTDGDGVLDGIDNCYLYNPDQADCNGNGIGDICDIADFASLDCDLNSVPDECQPDCDGDGWIDPCDHDADVDGDGIPDNCEEDCNGNGFPDHWEIEIGWAEDCNSNLIPDECDLTNDPSLDCDGNALFDECEIESDPSLDCDNNGILDSCDLMDHPVGETKLLASDGVTGDDFGKSVSISSDGATVIVGANDAYGNSPNSGSAYIYKFAGGVWEETKLLASDGAANDEFGISVSISGDGTTAIVGALHDGSAYIYSLVKGIWQETKLLASDGESIDFFGESVSISSDGSTAIVGARYDDDNGSASGSAYIYKLVGGVWQETKLLASDGASGDIFGGSVAVSGATAIVGACHDNDNGYESGSVYVYRFDGNNWIETKLLASDGAGWDLFGQSVAVSGDTVVVGASFDDNDNGYDSGSAYVYRFDGSNWIETKLLASDGAVDDYFGHSASLSSDGNTAIVGAHWNDDNGNDSGSAYVYRFDGSNWIETKLLASDGAVDDYFGYSVSLSSDGNTAIVGAHWNDDNGNDSGSAYMFGLGSDADCDGNGNIDSCDIDEDPTLDCNQDGILDSCQELDDCNENGIPDSCDLQDPNNDQNNNGELDDCECTGDITADGMVNIHDLLIVIGSWGSANPAADFNFDGIVNVHDLLLLIAAWGECE